jgi:hypothetical protein
MAIIAPLLAFLGRFVGKLIQMVFGWATILLFGRVPQSKQVLLSGVALGSIAWIAVLIGVLVPDLGTVLIAAVPAPDFLSDTWIRIAMLVAAVVLPLLVGIAGLFLLDPEDRPGGLGRVVQVLRGYPYAAVLAFVLLWLAVIAPIRKIRSIIKGWADAHIPVVVKPGGYERVGNDLESTLDGAGLPIERAKAPVVLETPSKLLALVGGGSVRRLVPNRLLVLRNRGLEVTIYPSDVAMTGTKDQVARARAAIATRITFTAAYLTASKESQRVEDMLAKIAEADPRAELTWRAFDAVDAELARLILPHEEWEVLYRLRLQVEQEVRERIDESVSSERGPLAAVGDAIRTVLP